MHYFKEKYDCIYRKRTVALLQREPEKDIKITEIGLRIGEKLTEELRTSSEKLLPTVHARIFVEDAPALSQNAVKEALKILAIALAREGNKEIIKEALQIAVPTYTQKKQ